MPNNAATLQMYGDFSDAILNAPLQIAHGIRKEDMNFINRVYTGEEFLGRITHFEKGVKDGSCILSGAVVPPASGQKGTRRVAVNMTANYIIMVDFDQGDEPLDVVAKMQALGLFAVVWTTHSHNKPYTYVPEKAVTDWLRKQGTPTSTPTDDQVIDFFKKNIKIYPSFLTDLRVAGKEIIPGGTHFRCEHKALPKCRALFFLTRKFDFAKRGGSQVEAIEEWKERYAGFCEQTLKMTGWDHACADPSRLMYLPRIGDDADIAQHSITVIAGNAVDLDTTPRIERVKDTRKPVASAAPVVNAFTTNANRNDDTPDNSAAAAGATDPNALKTSWLPKFLRQHAHDFEAEDWLKNLFSEGEMYQCPWSDLHTPNSTGGEDKGFKAWNASTKDGEGGFSLQCSHNGCRTDLERGMRADGKQDRAKYLDALIIKYGVTEVELLEFCPHAEEEEEARQAAAASHNTHVAQEVAAGDDDAKNETRIRSFTPETLWKDVEGMLRLLARRPKKEYGRVEQLVKLISKQTRLGAVGLMASLTGLRREFRAEQEELEMATAADTPDDPTMTPPSDLSAFVPLWPGHSEAWTELTVQLATLKQIERANRELPTPRLYQRPEGGVMRVTRSREGKLTVAAMDKDAWHYEIANVVQFKKQSMTGGRRHIPSPANVVSYVIGAPDKDFPMLEKVVRIPLFSEQGNLLTEPGYSPELRIFLDPTFELYAVSKTPSAEELDFALDLIDEALTDFPFSDIFNGDDQLEIKSELVDKGGHPMPNYERGEASRANMYALILQPFVQHLIRGSCPAYHIDKASPGTGAGFLTDVAFMISEGTRAVINTMSDNNEEFKKSITATLRQGCPIIFIDNINRKVDSGALAAALTSGVWQDRILGVSENARIDVKCAWVMAGNNLSFSNELMRRNVPIRLDAKTPNPALDRPKGFFKHHPLQDWLEASRPALVWACLTVVAHWFAVGQPRGNKTMNSFDHWAGIMGGILECCDIPGFLSNIPAYLDEKNEEAASTSDYVQAMWKQFSEKDFTAAMALAAVNDTWGNPQFGIPVDTDKSGPSQLAWFGSYIGKNLGGHTFWVHNPVSADPSAVYAARGGPDWPFKVTWIIEKSGNNKKHRLSPVRPKKADDPRKV